MTLSAHPRQPEMGEASPRPLVKSPISKARIGTAHQNFAPSCTPHVAGLFQILPTPKPLGSTCVR
ncbi:MAG TPA: hypothetical protein VF463_10810 [Sphingobium sp.]